MHPQCSASLHHLAHNSGAFCWTWGQLEFCITSEPHRTATQRVNLVMHLFSVGLCCVTFPGEMQTNAYSRHRPKKQFHPCLAWCIEEFNGVPCRNTGTSKGSCIEEKPTPA